MATAEPDCGPVGKCALVHVHHCTCIPRWLITYNVHAISEDVGHGRARGSSSTTTTTILSFSI